MRNVQASTNQTSHGTLSSDSYCTVVMNAAYFKNHPLCVDTVSCPEIAPTRMGPAQSLVLVTVLLKATSMPNATANQTKITIHHVAPCQILEAEEMQRPATKASETALLQERHNKYIPTCSQAHVRATQCRLDESRRSLEHTVLHI